MDGDDGAPGADGRTWYSGTPPPSNGTGQNGDYYLDTDDHAYYGPKAGGTWAGTGPTSLVGPTGATGPAGPEGPQGEQGETGPTGAAGSAGADGKTVLNGTADPTTEGVNGDFYIKTSGTPANWKIFGPKAAGSWPAGVALQGPTGATGAAGSDGTNGRDAGWNYKFNTATSGDAGTGKFRFNNATIASATSIAIHPTDDDGNSLSFWVGTWDDSLASIRGYVHVHKVGDPTTFVIFAVLDGSSAGGGSSTAFGGSVAASGGTLSNSDETMVSYVPTSLPAQRHYAQLRRDAAQSIGTGAYVDVTMDTNVRSFGVTVSLASASSVTITREGWYSIAGNFGLSANDVGASIEVNGVGVAMGQGETVLNVGRTAVSTTTYLSVGDVVNLSVAHSNAGSVNTSTGANARPTLTIVEMP